MIRTWRLDDGRQTLALASDGGVPWVVHWGAPLAPGDTLAIRIFQLSNLVGRGAPKTITLTL